MNISQEILFKKFLKPKLDNISNNLSNQNIKKSGSFTGLRNSITYTKNTTKRYAQKANDYLYLNKSATNKLDETFNMLEEVDGVVYKRNIKSIDGTNRSAVPHSVMQQSINKGSVPKPRNGIVPTMLNTKWGQQEIQKKYRNIARLFKNLNGV